MAAGPTEDLIVRLVADAAPVKRLAPARIRLARWLGGTTTLTAAAVWAIGAREDLGTALRDPTFAGDGLLTLATAALAAATAFSLSVPGADGTRLRRWLPIGSAAVWIAWLATRVSAAPGAWHTFATEPWHLACGARLLLVAAGPAAGAFLMIRRAAPLQPGWAATMAALAALGFAAVAVRVLCPIDAPAHLLVMHAGSFVLLTALSGAIGAPRLRDRRPTGFV